MERLYQNQRTYLFQALISFSVLIFIFSCKTNQVLVEQGNLVTSSYVSPLECKPMIEIKTYTWLYGSYSINETKFQSEKYKKIRIREEVSIPDLIWTIPLGVLFSIGKKTTIYEDCGPIPEVETELLVKERSKILEEVEKEYNQLPQLLTDRAKRELGENFNSQLPLVWFIDGRIKQGKVINQNSEELELETSDGKRQKYLRRDILKVRYAVD
ncbi:hypothetical protein LEP1GSC202_2857 [Leptospira yanagawae serovar Saopaulo str. Sao Paulo = ATCC 700523]|uniref:Lipoprotein n=2 Tax=Leptospira yanagawae TaxID=293069 RepID=A0A5E8HBW0_9LEPT|nr:hypothetical protein [Leptospira yanagawae]EOQ87506.1 hypothetical protein LEP1GSC202_2857 [Leptospira yanagawae serovar Saopaulo str. Sao Paulo = ATCC 700523]